jgi:ATP-dependent DNA ligase
MISLAFIEPMQCKPFTALPAGEQWTFEIKFDGYRCIAVKCAREVTLFSRHGKVLNKRFPFAVEALASLGGDFVLDGRHRSTRKTFISTPAKQSAPVYSDLLLRL